jgi:hypothetical protein
MLCFMFSVYASTDLLTSFKTKRVVCLGSLCCVKLHLYVLADTFLARCVWTAAAAGGKQNAFPRLLFPSDKADRRASGSN